MQVVPRGISGLYDANSLDETKPSLTGVDDSRLPIQRL